MSGIISLERVAFSYAGPGRRAERGLFHDLSLEIPGGAVTVILGPNGCGKSTLLHIILGALAPGRGAVRLDGRPHQGYSRRDLGRLMGLVAQEETIPFNFSVLEYVLLGRAPHLHFLRTPGPADVAAARAALEAVGVAHLSLRPIQSLSGGERQLVLIARALAQQPRILLLDEPTSHLDLANKWRVLALLRELAAGGVAVVFTTHEPDIAAAIAEYAILLRAGEPLAAGPVAEVLTSTRLSATYGVAVEVAEVAGRRMIVPPSLA